MADQTEIKDDGNLHLFWLVTAFSFSSAFIPVIVKFVSDNTKYRKHNIFADLGLLNTLSCRRRLNLFFVSFDRL